MSITLSTVIRVLKRHALWLLLFPALLAGVVFYMTRDLPLEFTSTATVYTGIASGYSITSAGGDRADNTAINNAFDNLIITIKSRETLSEVSLRLLAKHLTLRKPSADQLNWGSFLAVRQLLDPALKQAVVPDDASATFVNLERLLAQPDGNSLKSLLYQSTAVYAVESILGRITVARKSNSDMIDLSCKGNDPAICQQTLALLIDVFRRRYTSLKTAETGNVVGYFEQQRQQAYNKLRGAEDQLTKYSVDNKIINYPEQSKFTAASKESIMSEYLREKMNLKATNAALSALDGKLDERSSALMINKELDAKRTELANAQTQVANAMLYDYPKETITKLRATSNRLSDEMKVLVQRHYNSTHTLESVPQEDLMSSYLQNSLRSKESATRLGEMQTQIKDFNQVYDEMAPLGSAVGRLQRQINVSEGEYLSVLNGLNMAQVRQKDLQIKGALSVIDPPSLPMKPMPTIRRLLIMVSFMAGLVLVLSVAFGRLLLSGAIASPERVEPTVSVPLAAALPARRFQFAHYDLDFAEHCMLEQLRSRILVDTQQASATGHSYRLITVFSTRPKQGKSWVGSRISDLFAEGGHRVAYLYADKLLSPVAMPTQAHSMAYPMLTDFDDADRVTELLQSIPPLAASAYDYVFLELPALLDTAMPVQLVSQSDMSILVVNARASWSRSDQELCNLYKRAARGPVVAVLNEVEPDRLEVLMGPLPKRSKLQRSQGRGLVRKNKET